MSGWHGKLFQGIEHFWLNLRLFAYNSRTIFEIIFVFLYAIEQAFLIWFTYNTHNLIELSYVISIFAIIVLTTFSMHKLLMESRIKCLEEDLNEVQQKKHFLEQSVREARSNYQELYDKIQEEMSIILNTPTLCTNKKRDKHERK